MPAIRNVKYPRQEDGVIADVNAALATTRGARATILDLAARLAADNNRAALN